jgi:hypothetical protein
MIDDRLRRARQRNSDSSAGAGRHETERSDQRNAATVTSGMRAGFRCLRSDIDPLTGSGATSRAGHCVILEDTLEFGQ